MNAHETMPEPDERAWQERNAGFSPREVVWICPFCGNELPDERAACCGEVGCAVDAESPDNPWRDDEDF